MKRQDPHLELARWLTAEDDGDVETADAALTALFCELPEEPLPAAFADQVLARLPRREAEAPLAHWLRWAVLGAGAFGFLLAVFFVVKPLLDPFFRAFGWNDLAPDSLTGWAAALVSLVGRSLAGMLAGWQKTMELSTGVTRLLESPQIALTAAGSIALGAFALYALSHLLRPAHLRAARNFRHVDV